MTATAICVSGNELADVDPALGEVDGTQVLGNYVGTDLDRDRGASPTARTASCSRRRPATTLGSPAAPNLISGNALSGVELIDEDSAANVVQSNLIGTAADGAGALRQRRRTGC